MKEYQKNKQLKQGKLKKNKDNDKSEIQRLRQQIYLIEGQIGKQQKQRQYRVSQNNKLKMIHRQQQKRLKKQYQQLCANTKLLMIKKQQIQKIKQKQKSIRNPLPFLTQSSILDYYKDRQSIEFIKNQLQQLKSKNIVKSKTLCKNNYFIHNDLSFHQFIDHVPNILLILKLKNNYQIAAFTQLPFTEGIKQRGNGLLMSITNNKSYKLKQHQKKAAAILYGCDLIWGYKQLMIQFPIREDKKIFSRFDNKNGYYDNGNDTIKDFIGSEQRQQQYQSFQLIYVQFQGEQQVKKEVQWNIDNRYDQYFNRY